MSIVPGYVEPEDKYVALVEYSKNLKHIRDLEKKKEEIAARNTKIAMKFPFLLKIDIVRARPYTAPDEEQRENEEMEEKEEEDSEKEKKRKKNQKLKEKRKKKKNKKEESEDSEKKANEAAEGVEVISLSEDDSPKTFPLPDPNESRIELSEEAKTELLKTLDAQQSAKKPKILPKPLRFSVNKSSSPAKTNEGGQSTSVRSGLLHVDGSHRGNLTGNPESIVDS